MAIESDLKRIADTLEGILAILSGGEAAPITKRGPGRPPKQEKAAEEKAVGEAQSAAPAAAEPAGSSSSAAPLSTSAAAESPDLTMAVRERVKAVIGLGKRDPLLALVKKHGGESASTIPVENQKAFLDESAALL